jgi:hypothetical protein
MSAEIITLPIVRIERSDSNGACEALTEIGNACPFHIDEDDAIHWAEDILMRLWDRGFKVVALDSTDIAEK